MKIVKLNILIDAMGWELLRKNEFLVKECPFRCGLETVLGYSASAVPSVLTGATPDQTGKLSYFYYSPETSPFRFGVLDFLPNWFTDRGKVRMFLRKWVQRSKGYSGAFELYKVPFRVLKYCDVEAKNESFGINAYSVETFIDVWHRKNIPYRIFTWPTKDTDIIQQTIDSLAQQEAQEYFLYLPSLDAVMHRYGTKSTETQKQLAVYEAAVRKIFRVAERNAEEVILNIFSDHGMTDINEGCNVKSKIDQLGLKEPTDYLAMYDSTMARFWTFTEKAQKLIKNQLAGLDCGKVMEKDDLKEIDAYWPDYKFGNIVFVTNPGVLLHPSYMSHHMLAAMHGFHPRNDKHASAVLLSNRKIPEGLNHIRDIKNHIVGRS